MELYRFVTKCLVGFTQPVRCDLLNKSAVQTSTVENDSAVRGGHESSVRFVNRRVSSCYLFGFADLQTPDGDFSNPNPSYDRSRDIVYFFFLLLLIFILCRAIISQMKIRSP